MSTDSQYLPPVSSMGSSRGSSFDLETSDGSSPYRNGSLPSLTNSTRSPSMSYPEVQGNGWEENRYQLYQQDYRQYSTDSSLPPGPYRGGSPGRSLMPGQYRQPYMQGHMDGMESGDARTAGKRKRGNLPKHVTDILRQWFDEHENHPYPTEEEKQMLLMKTGLAMSQVISLPLQFSLLLTTLRLATGLSMREDDGRQIQAAGEIRHHLLIVFPSFSVRLRAELFDPRIMQSNADSPVIHRFRQSSA